MTRSTYTPGTDSIDITAPGGIDALLAFHRRTFGDAVMEDTGGAPAGGEPAGGDPAAGDPAVSEPADDADKGKAKGDALPDDPAALKAEIAKLRKENGAERTNAKQKAADDAVAQLTDKLAVALGIKKEGEKPTADELQKQLTARDAAAKQAVTELAIYRAAGANGASPDALLDSRSFLAKVAELDPSEKGFSDKVSAAIKAAVAENPKLKAAPGAGTSSVDHAGGTGERPKQPASLSAAVTAAYTKP